MSENYMAKKLFDEGAAAYLKQDYHESIKLFTQALKNDRKYALVYSGRGTAYLKLKKFKKDSASVMVTRNYLFKAKDLEKPY